MQGGFKPEAQQLDEADFDGLRRAGQAALGKCGGAKQ